MLPDFIDPEAWCGFVHMRKVIKKPLTARAEVLILKKLIELKNKGHDPNLALDESTEHNWLSVFPPRAIDVPNLLPTYYAQEPRMTPLEQERADAARKLAMSAIRRVA